MAQGIKAPNLKMNNYKQEISEIYANGINYDELTLLSSNKRAFHLWEISPKLQLVGLNRSGVLDFLKEQSYYKRKSSSGTWFYSKVTDNVIEVVKPSDINDFVRSYIGCIDFPVTVRLGNSSQEISPDQFRDIYLKQQHLIFNDGFLSNLVADEREILRDTKETAFTLFRNTVVCISAETIELKSYSDFKDKTFYRSQIIDKDFAFEKDWKNGSFAKFAKNISNDNAERKKSLRSAIGYLLHEFNDPSKTQAVILYDEAISDKQQGGTGKGIIGQAIAQMKLGFVQMDGKGTNVKSQFLFQQIKPDTRVIIIDDVPKGFEIDRLNSVLTEGINVEKKFKPIFHIPKELMPKILINSNYILPFHGSTRIRRQFIFELSDYYSKQIRKGTEQPVLNEHKVMFFSSEWTGFEWNAFYSFMIICIQFYLKNGLVPFPANNTHINWLIQKIGMPSFRWLEEKQFTAGTAHEVNPLYEKYKNECIACDIEIGQRQFSINISEYLKCKGLNSRFHKGILYIS